MSRHFGVLAATAVLALAAGTAPAPAQNDNAGQAGMAAALSPEDLIFLQEAMAGGLAEVATAEMALERAASEEVRGFAQQMLQDHPPVNEQLAAIATAHGVPVPAELAPRHQDMMVQLSQLEGEGFDQTYMAGQLAEHQLAVDLFSREASGGQDPMLTALASQTLPALQMHTEMAAALSDQVGAPAQ